MNFQTDNDQKIFTDCNGVASILYFPKFDKVKLSELNNRKIIRLDGNEYLEFNYNNHYNIFRSSTIMIAFKPKFQSKDSNLILLSSLSSQSINGGFEIYAFRTMSKTNKDENYTYRFKSNDGVDDVEKLLKPDQWNLRTAVFCETTKTIYDYLNGELIAKSEILNYIPQYLKHRIGANKNNKELKSSDYFIGELSDFSILHGCYTQEEIKKYYNNIMKDLSETKVEIKV